MGPFACGILKRVFARKYSMVTPLLCDAYRFSCLSIQVGLLTASQSRFQLSHLSLPDLAIRNCGSGGFQSRVPSDISRQDHLPMMQIVRTSSVSSEDILIRYEPSLHIRILS
jgi:hypothetical protein